MDAALQRALERLKRYGWNTTSFQLLEPGYSYFFDGDDGLVAYMDTGRAWVAGGAPVGREERLAEIAARFAESAAGQGRAVCFFAAGERFIRATGWRTLHIGEQPTWEPSNWDKALSSAPSLREQLRRARAKGVSVRQLAPEELEEGSSVRKAMQDLIDQWLGAQSMAPLGFLVDVQPFEFPEERLFFVAERQGELVGFLAAVPIYGRRGWLFEDLLRAHPAPNGTSELLVDAGMRAAANLGARLVTLGMAPLSGDVPRGLRWIRELSKPLYDFGGLRAFKAKFRPHAWEPLFLAVPPGAAVGSALLESLRAFAGGSFWAFGFQTLVKGPLFAVWALTGLLAVWIPLLALANPAQWFAATWIQKAWLGFDAVLLFLLVSLARGYRKSLGILLASLVTADAALTLFEAIRWNVPRVETVGQGATLLLACAGPVLASVVLWGMVRSRAQLQSNRTDRELG